MSILLGSDRIHSGAHRGLRLAKLMLIAVLLGIVAGIVVDGWLAMRGGYTLTDLQTVKAYLLRRAGVGWGVEGAWPLLTALNDPADLAPASQTAAQRASLRRVPVKSLDGYVVRRWLRRYRPAVETGGLIIAGCAGGFAMLLLIAIRGLGASAKEETLRRGAQLVAPGKLSGMACEKAHGDFCLAGVRVPGEIFYRHALAIGSPGAGKSQCLSDLLDQIRARGERAIIYDPGSEFLQTHLKPGDTILNPYDQRSAGWSIFSELENPWDYQALATSIVQPPSGGAGQNEFFYEGSRIVLAEGLRLLHEQHLRGRIIPTSTVAEFLTTTPLDSLHKTFALARSPAAQYLDPAGKNQGPNIRSTLGTKLAAWPHIIDGDFCVRDWAREPGSDWVFLTTRVDQHAALEPLISLWIELAVTELLCRQSDSGERIWLIVDELGSLQRLQALLRLLSMGRKYRAAVVLATQTPSQLAGIYGRDGAASLAGTVGNRVTFRLEDPDNCESASKFFGQAEVEGMRETSQMGTGARGQAAGRNLAEDRREERLILPSQIQALPDLRAYIKLAGGLPAAATRQKYIARPRIAEAFVPRVAGSGRAPVDQQPNDMTTRIAEANAREERAARDDIWS